MRRLIIVAWAAAVSIAVPACSFKSDAQVAAEAKVAIRGLIPEAATACSGGHGECYIRGTTCQ